MKTLLCLIAGLILVTGCSSAGPRVADADAEQWPRVSMEMRVLMVDTLLLEEFGIELERLAEPSRLPADGAFCVAIDDLSVKLLVSATLAHQHSLSLNSPRLTLEPGEAGKMWVGSRLTFINDLGNEHLYDEGGIGFEFVAELADPDDPTSPLRVVVLARFLPEGVYRGDELQWRGGEGAQAYFGPTIRAQALCESGSTHLAAAPAPDPDDPDARRMLLLFKPVLVASPEEELEFFPGLDAPPKTLR